MKWHILFLFWVVTAWAGAGLETVFVTPKWQEKTASQLLKLYPKILLPSDKDGNGLSAVGAEAKSLKIWKHQIQELRIELKDKRVDEVKIFVYNRGDAGEWDFKKFQGCLRDLLSNIKPQFNSTAERRTFSPTSQVKIIELVWRDKTRDLALSAGIGRGRKPEFISITISPPGSVNSTLRQASKVQKDLKELAKMVQTSPEGEKFIPIPMVNQGDKGYCVPATIERILQYYGSQLDQHAIAKMLDTGADTGTRMDKIGDTLAKIDTKLGCRYRCLYRFDDLDKERGLRNFCRLYNRFARKADKPLIKMNKNVLNTTIFYDIFKKVRNSSELNRNKFMNGVKNHIDQGIPLLWTVLIFPKQSGGKVSGHMRVINGYHPETKKILFSDSWGVGNEKSNLEFEDAWAITTGLFLLAPVSK